MEQTYSFKVKASDEDKAKALKSGKDLKQETKDVKLASGLKVGETVTLDGKKSKITGLTLNADNGHYDVDSEEVVDQANQPIAAEGNDPHPERRAVKDVLFDPRFSPKVVDAVAVSNKIIDQKADIDEHRKEAEKKSGPPLKGDSHVERATLSPAGPFEKAGAKHA